MHTHFNETQWFNNDQLRSETQDLKNPCFITFNLVTGVEHTWIAAKMQ